MFTRIALGTAVAAVLSMAGAAHAADIYRPNSSPAYGPALRPSLPIVNPSPAYPTGPAIVPPKPIIVPRPIFVTPPVIIPEFTPQPCIVDGESRSLERYVERLIRREFGRSAGRIDVDISAVSRRANVEVEISGRRNLRDLELLLASIPELDGYRIRIDVD